MPCCKKSTNNVIFLLISFTKSMTNDEFDMLN